MATLPQAMSTETWEALKAAKKVFSSHKSLTLVTSADGDTWASKVYFAEDDGYLYGVTERPVGSRGRNTQNMLRNSKVFFVIERGVPDRFVQGEGVIEILGDVSERPERHILFRKALEVVPFANFFPLLVFRIRPTALYISDYSEEWKPRAVVEVTDQVLEAFRTHLKTRQRPWEVSWKAVRYFSFTATLFAILLGALLAPAISWWLLLLTIVGGLLLHAGVNVVSDNFDYKRGADTWRTLGSSRVLVDGLVAPWAHLRLGLLLLLGGVGLGLALVALKGLPVLYLGLAGVFLGVFYTAPPVGMKYRALGDMAVFFAFGPLMALGSYYVQAQTISWTPVLVSVPVGLLTIAILHGNNFRDIQQDIQSGYRTVAAFLGLRGSGLYYLALVCGAYLATVAEVAAGVLPLWALLVLLTGWLARRNIRAAFQLRRVAFTFLDLVTAELHLYFGLLLNLAIALARWV